MKTIALLHTNSTSSTWEFYASGAERECRIKPVDATATITTEEATFFLYDHLGNTRITYTPEEVNGLTGIRINSVVDYFPYGKVLREFYNGQQERYLTTQHERDEATGLDYRGARYYDSDLGRFLSLDPHAKDYPSLSYVYVAGNPVAYIEPLGTDVEKPTTKSDKGDGGTKLVLPENARVTNRFVDKDNNGKINWGKKTLEAKAGDVDRFEVDGTGYRANFNKDGSFNDYYDANGNAYQSPTSSVSSSSNTSGSKGTGGFFIEFGGSFHVGGGVTYSQGMVFDGNGNSKHYTTVGGGLGFSATGGFDGGIIQATTSRDFSVNDWQGAGFSANFQIGPLEFSKSGDQKKPEFGWDGKSYNAYGGLTATQQNMFSLLLDKFDAGAGASYNWTKTWNH